ncbi:MAG TPA: glycosyltransferase [Thermoanaerobaculales bacterium]|nr:glycosyltransferase [Thermoanaerobaculales bacterium]HQP42047.1 glycosyltransferase [Thermoanaerobaculales bacterium]
MKVLDLTNFYSSTGGGVRTYLRHKMRWLPRLSIERHVLVLPSSVDQTLDQGATRIYELAGPRVPGQPSYRALVRPGRIWRILRDEAPDIVEIGSPYLLPPMVVPMARSLGIRCVGFLHADYPRAYFRPWGDRLQARTGLPLGPLIGGIAERHMRATYRALDGTCVAVPGTLRRLERLGVPHLYHTPLGVDLEQFHPSRRSCALASELGVGGGHPWCLCVARLSREKGVETLVAAMELARCERPLELVLVGDGPLRPEIARLEADRPWLHWVPQIDEPARLAALHASTDFLVAPGVAETFGLAVLEALASGCPVVGANAGAIAELLAGSEAGLLFEAGDPVDLGRSLVRMVDAPRPRLSEAARDLARGRSWERAFKGVLGAYSDVLERRPRRAARRQPRVDSSSKKPVDTPASRDLAWASAAAP